MNYDNKKSIEILERTPLVLENMLSGLSVEWTACNEGENTWSPFDIVGHLIIGEKTDWITRVNIILGDDSNKTFQPFDRFAQFSMSKGKSLNFLLTEFKNLRIQNIDILKSLTLNETTLKKEGIHPVFGNVTLTQLLAAWVVHDLGHLGQINRVMAKQYTEEVGPWKKYLPILTK